MPRPHEFLIDAGWFKTGTAMGFLTYWDPAPDEFEGWLARILERGATLVDITVFDCTFP